MAELERVHWLVNRPYGFDSQFRLHYGEVGEKTLNPLEPIVDENLCLGIVDGHNLSTKKMRFRESDSNPIRVTRPGNGETIEFTLPGKSAHIVFTPNLCDRSLLKDIVVNFMFDELDRRDHLHIATVRDIKAAGWVTYWAPLQFEKNLPHVRMVANRTIETGEPPTVGDISELIQVFKEAV